MCIRDRFTAKDRQLPIETARATATILLVLYHVIGASPTTGLGIGYPSPLRLFADFFLDLRMPVFAMIAGLVFAIRPLAPGGLPGFFLGKARRLVIPGIVAILAFEGAAALGHTPMATHGEYLQPFLTGYAHFWFLQSILLIFVVYAPLDSLTNGRIAPYALAGACALSLSHSGLPHNPFSLDGAMMLLPYFILGVLVWRHRVWLLAHSRPVLAGALILLVIGSLWNIEILRATGIFSDDRRDLQSLLSAMGGCLAVLLLLPRIGFLDRIAAISFTIYLYHVFGTSLMRRLLHMLGVQDLTVHVLMGLAAGLILPFVLHRLAERYDLTRFLVLGLKPLQPQQGRSGHRSPARHKVTNSTF